MHGQVSRRELLRGKGMSPQSQSEGFAIDSGDQPTTAHISANCLAYEGTTCRMCEEHCDEDAISFQLMTGGRALPLVADNSCTGCGACAEICPPKAITLRPQTRGDAP